MDYCYQCRRTLNGALVCPGCGAYAPDIAPPVSAYRPPHHSGERISAMPSARLLPD
ncbi:SCO2400 family protein, partial [Actinacidiphila cocklensis]|uniref:SCO2400 family protein n=1 Tax=Actinacidiphila cocklensis TaxID=887465 RepID=UPI003BEEC073